MYSKSSTLRGYQGLGAWPDSPSMDATPAQLYQEYVAYNTAHGNANGPWKALDPDYLGQYLWDQIHPPDLINTGQWGSDVAAIGYKGTTAEAPATAWVQHQDGSLENAVTGEVLDRVPGSPTPAEAAAADQVRREEEEAAADPIPDGFYLDPDVEAEWERLNRPRVAPSSGDGDEVGGESLGLSNPLVLAGLGALALLFVALPAGRRRH